MNDRPDHPEDPPHVDPQPAAREPAGGGSVGAARADTAAPNLAAGSPHYQDLTIARQLRAARASLGAAVRAAAAPTIPAELSSSAGAPDDLEARAPDASTSALGSALWLMRRRLSWDVPEVRLAAVLLALLLAGVIVTQPPQGVAMTRAPQPGQPDRPAVGPGVQPPSTTAQHGTATTEPGKSTGPISGGQAPQPAGPVDREPVGGTPVRSPTTQARSPSQPGTPAPPPPSTNSPPATGPAPTPTTVGTVPTTGPAVTTLPPTTTPPTESTGAP